MIESIVMANFQDLALNPELTQANAIIFIGLLFGLLVAGIRLRSPAVLVTWFFMILSFVGVILLGLNFVFFWFATLITGAAIVVSIIIKGTYASR